MLYRIVGVDPGETTGVVRFLIDNNEINCMEAYELELMGVGQYLSYGGFDYVAYEVANKFQASGHISSEVIGIAKFFGYQKGAQLVPVNQSSWKRLITRDVLKKAGLNVKGTHAKDAAGVGLFAAVQLKLIDPWFLRSEIDHESEKNHKTKELGEGSKDS